MTRLPQLGFAVTLALLGACAQHSPYQGQESRRIKSLSAEEVDGYLEGRGMGYAKPAELNGYPGPMHVLELADRLALTSEQRTATQALLGEHKAEVRELGRRYVESEAQVDALFASRKVSAESLADALARSADLQRRIRLSHLSTHVRQTALLTPEQVDAYVRLRGYTSHAH
jgi:Spy/CpxP family protein refolding chaperone